MIIGCALFMELLDSTAVLTALTQIATDFGEASVRMNLIVSLYLLAAALFIPISGWLAERFGPRRVFITAICLFMLCSLACAASASLLQLSLARFCQGASGALMVPVGQIILLRGTSKANLMRAMAFLTMPALLGPVLGPPLGGLLVTALSWHWIFLINLPIGLLGIVLVIRHVPDYCGQQQHPLDKVGFVLSSAALASLMLAFESLGHGQLLGGYWPALLLATGIVFGGFYLHHTKRYPTPLLDLSLLRIPTFGIVLLGGMLFRLGSAALPFLLVLLFQVGFGLSALQAGLMTFAGGAGALVIKFISVRLVRRFGFRRILVCNAIISAACMALCALLRPDTGMVLTLLLLFSGGVSRSLQMSTLGALGYADVSREQAGQASTLSAMSVQLGMSLAVCIAALLLGLIQHTNGHGVPAIEDIGLAMALASLLCVLSALIFSRLGQESGQAVASG
ncbi:MFS transporter [Pseudomonas putida]|uniref:Major facilitator transporter n=1 Tax=Pseudomonas putida S13.1.2 TaxID=1384061 RepID=A0AAU8RRZ9_PSEPU|nr:MFS transporter [Pseudomonas putida]AJQ46481.1 major facilitator transporter [Pseudomonas putida S13.1.2]